jgi:hypothetical protein
MQFPQINQLSRFGNTLDLTFGNSHKLINIIKGRRNVSIPPKAEEPGSERRITSEIDSKIEALDCYFSRINKEKPGLPKVREPRTTKHTKIGSYSFLAVARKQKETNNPPVGYYNPIYTTCLSPVSKSKKLALNRLRPIAYKDISITEEYVCNKFE